MIEICAGSYQDCITAFKAGAKRVELNSALSAGGLTPSIAALRRVKKETSLKVICMVRIRAAGFCYDKEDIELMLEQAKLLLENGADGIAFGFLNEDGTIYEKATRQMINLIHSYHKEAVFHRAFDITKDPFQAIETLINLKCDRILTSGQKSKAMQGMELIKNLQEKYGQQIEILAGSGMNHKNIQEMKNYTKIKQVHSSCKGYRIDPTTSNDSVSYSYIDNTNQYDVVDFDLVEKLVKEDLKSN
ncbi:MAG: copper homeostasis protein CutC [Erysipelotrichaceae bacterium]|nr:copper homeostasis protein CutC [Erysipelotrichaceae bacterium]